jgi:dihydroorotate dehydrogenase
MLYRSLLRPILFRLPPEMAHELALHSLTLTLGNHLTQDLFAKRFNRSPFGELKRFGLTFTNPIGLAAGFDKNGIAIDALAALGFGHIEAGTVTWQPQPGNPKPRLFRLPEDQALINRAGFNNHGAVAFVRSVNHRRPACVLGVSIGKSRVAPLEDAVSDYLKCFETIYPIADYVAVNVSSPNTPGLRDLQQADQLEGLLQTLQVRNQELAKLASRSCLPLLVKLAPDLDQKETELIVDVARRAKVAGIIAINTTVARGGLRAPAAKVDACGAGGLSGAPLRRRSTEMIANLYLLAAGSMAIVGVGGVFTAADAWEKICAGASLVQLYTGFIYQGPSIAREINDGLAEIVKREKFGSLDEAIGSRAREFASTGQ